VHKLYEKNKGVGLIEVLVSLTILSTVMLASLSYALNGIKLSQNSLWDTDTISCFSSFFERIQLVPEILLSDSESLDLELNYLNQMLKEHAPLTIAKIVSQDNQMKLVMTRADNRNIMRVSKVEAIIQ
jgi:prepilin-type N-terminal cleavage/methylation domain-containing protein